RRSGGYPRYPRAAARRQGAGRLSLPARDAGVLDRSAEPLSQAGIRARQEVRFFLCRRLALRAGRANRATDGTETRGAYRRRLRCLETGGRPGRGAGREKILTSI